MNNRLIIPIVILILAGCASSKKTTNLAPSQTDVDKVASKYPGYTLANLIEGKKLYEDNCASCHGLKKPSSRNEEQWKNIVPIMIKKVNKKAGGDVLDESKQQLILKYLVTMGSKQ